MPQVKLSPKNKTSLSVVSGMLSAAVLDAARFRLPLRRFFGAYGEDMKKKLKLKNATQRQMENKGYLCTVYIRTVLPVPGTVLYCIML